MDDHLDPSPIWRLYAGRAVSAPYEHLLTTILANGKVLVTGRRGSNDSTGSDGNPIPQGGAE